MFDITRGYHWPPKHPQGGPQEPERLSVDPRLDGDASAAGDPSVAVAAQQRRSLHCGAAGRGQRGQDGAVAGGVEELGRLGSFEAGTWQLGEMGVEHEQKITKTQRLRERWD